MLKKSDAYFLMRYMVFIGIMLISMSGLSYASCQEGERKIVMLAVDGLSLEEWEYAHENFPHIRAVLDESYLSLMNTGTGGHLNSENAYVTIGAGARALGSAEAGKAFNYDENYGDYPAHIIYSRHTGREAEGEVLHPGIGALTAANITRNYRVVPGTLGTLLREAGYKGAVLGNGDHGEFNRLGVNLVMDERGIVDYGMVSKDILKPEGEMPFGYVMDVEILWKKLQEIKEESQFIVIDWGDIFRLRQSIPLLSAERAEELFDAQLKSLDDFLNRLLPQINGRTLLIIVTPNPQGVIRSSGDLLSLMALNYGNGRKGILTSDTTRRPGMVSNIDIAPTVLNFLGVSLPPYLFGSPVNVLTHEGDLDSLTNINHRIHMVYHQRPPLIKFYILLQIISVLGAAAVLILRINYYRYFKPLMAGLMLVPLFFLILPIFMTDNLYVSYALMVIVTALLTAVFLFRASHVRLFFRIGAVISLALILDLLTGASLVKNSVLGYDPISGARFYGIGNEYMGILIGSAVLFVASLYQLEIKPRRLVSVLSALFFLLVTYLFISPRWGANFGGSLTALTAFTISYLGLEDRKLCRGTLLRAAGIVVLFVLALVLLNFKGEGGTVSHVGRAMALVSREGMTEAVDIIIRKGSMNLKLLRWSLWSRILVIFLSLMIFLFFQPPGLLRKIKDIYPELSKGFIGIIAGSVTAIFANDSGVVAGATTLIYAGIPLLLLALDFQSRTKLNKGRGNGEN